jgi:acyl-CoA thioesterase-1
MSTVVDPVRRLLRNASTTMMGVEAVSEFLELESGSKGDPLGKIKAVIRRYELRLDLVLILAGLLVPAGCSSEHSAKAASEQGAAVTSDRSAQPSPTIDPPAPASLASSSDSTADSRPLIVCFGDSLTAGLGIESTASYPADLQHLLDAAGYRYRVVNEGVSGDTTKDGLERLDSVIAHKPQIVILEFGGNDGLRGLPVSMVQQNIATMIERLQHSGIKIALAGISLPPQYGQDYIAHFDAMYPTLARQFRLPLLPFILQDVYGVDGDIQSDGVHPTAQGAKQVAANVQKLIQPMLKK